jgi:hypothetical protein
LPFNTKEVIRSPVKAKILNDHNIANPLKQEGEKLRLWILPRQFRQKDSKLSGSATAPIGVKDLSTQRLRNGPRDVGPFLRGKTIQTACSIGPIAAMALPPQIAVPAVIR